MPCLQERTVAEPFGEAVAEEAPPLDMVLELEQHEANLGEQKPS